MKIIMSSPNLTEVFLAILRSVMTNTPVALPEEIDQYMNELLMLARQNDVLQIICQGIKNNHGNLPANIDNEILRDLYRNAQNEYTLNTAKKIFESAGIAYVPLKGSVIRELYPEKRMRSSCDVDVLVKEDKLEEAINALVSAGFKTNNKREYHDVSLYYGEAHLELHYNICENIPRIDKVLSHVWDYVRLVSEYEYREVPAFFAFHIIAHMLYHFIRGGCNAKQFVDLWLLKENKVYSEKDLKLLLEKAKLEKFYEVICKTLDVWFADGEPNEITRNIEFQVINGGLYGGVEYSDAISIFMSGGKIKYLVSSTFVPLREMKWYYPVLKDYPMLLPFFYCKRLFSKTFGREKDRAKKLLQVDYNGADKRQDEIIDLLDKMGLG